MAEAQGSPRERLRRLRRRQAALKAEHEQVLDDIAAAITAARGHRPPVTWGAIAADLGLASPQAAQGIAQRRAARAAQLERSHTVATEETPQTIAQAHAAGAIDRAALIGALIAYPYTPDPHEIPDVADDGPHLAATGSAGVELGALVDAGLLDDEAYDAVLHGIAAARA